MPQPRYITYIKSATQVIEKENKPLLMFLKSYVSQIRVKFIF